MEFRIGYRGVFFGGGRLGFIQVPNKINDEIMDAVQHLAELNEEVLERLHVDVRCIPQVWIIEVNGRNGKIWQ